MASKSLFSKIFSKLFKRGNQQNQAGGGILRRELPQFKYIFFIVDWKRLKVVSEILKKEDVRFHLVSKCRGTAKSDMLDLLGIGSEDKALVTCIEQTVLVPILMKEVRKEICVKNPGQGIAFAIPLSAINNPILLAFQQSIFKNKKISAAAVAANTSKRGKTMSKEFTHDLIVSVVNNGYSDALMNTARAAGAAGGTVLHARSQSHEGMIKLFGISVQDEREIILILTSREKKVPIMRAISEAHGLNSETQGIIFSLPVDDVLGLNFEEV